MHINIKNKTLLFGNYKAKCAVGKRGISKNKLEGDKKTPKGTFKIEYLLYRADRNKSIKTKIKKRIIKKNMGWCDDSQAKEYNQLIRYPFKYSAEKLYRQDHLYDLIIVLDYNRKKIKKKRGSAIFLHLQKNNYQATKGCIALKKKDLLFILKFITKDTKIKIN